LTEWGEIDKSTYNVLFELRKKEDEDQKYPAFVLLPKDHEDEDPGCQDKVKLLKKHLRDFAENYDFDDFYGMVAGIDRMVFVKFSKKAKRFFESHEFSIDVEATYLKNQDLDFLMMIYSTIVHNIEKARSDFIMKIC